MAPWEDTASSFNEWIHRIFPSRDTTIYSGTRKGNAELGLFRSDNKGTYVIFDVPILMSSEIRNKDGLLVGHLASNIANLENGYYYYYCIFAYKKVVKKIFL